MSQYSNRYGQPIGFPLDDWQERSPPSRSAMAGDYCQLVPLDPERHAKALYQAFSAAHSDSNWTYLAYGPFHHFDEFYAWLQTDCTGDDPLFYTIVDGAAALGIASYLRIEPKTGVIEVGHIHFSNRLQKTALATEAMFLMMQRVFDELAYRRYEWKCDALNAPSRQAALRLGFVFEGIFRQATIYKNRNRDTAWFSITDREWPRLKQGFQQWLAPANFTPDGRQRERLSAFFPPAGKPL